MRWARSPCRSSWVGVCALTAAGVTSGFVVAGASAATHAATASEPPLWPARVLDSTRTGLSAPAGIAFSPATTTFYLVQGSPERGSAPPETDIVELKTSPTSAPEGTGSTRLAATVHDPINLAFDARASRLLFLAHARELFEVPAAAGGELDARKLRRRDAGDLGLVDPRGLAVDPETGIVYVLDGDPARILRLEPRYDGSFEQATTSEIRLSASSLSDPRGFAYDASSGHLYLRAGTQLYELTTGGEVVRVRDLTGLELVNPSGLVFAPSGDQTDDPAVTSLYVADTGGGSPQPSGRVVELSLGRLATPAAIDFTSQLIRTVDLGALSPPSPDPSGITYVPSTDRLLISDGEVEETVNGITHFQGANVWELNRNGLTLNRTANISTVPPTVTPMTNEPAGAAFNPSTGHLYFSADGARRIFDLDPGADRLVGTADDSWTSFNTHAQNSDPEGVTYNAVNGRLYVADGVNREVYEYSTAGVLLGHFDTAQHGVDDPETVEANPQTGTLYVLSNRESGPIIIETTTDGALLQTIDVSAAAGEQKPAGLAYASASNGSGAKRFYWVDRGIDNDSNPNAVDGKLFEMTTPSPPSGPLNWAANNSADFDGDRVTDFGLYRGRSPADSLWYAPGTAGGGPFQISFGASSDIPVPGDYDGDGETDAVIFRPSTGLWYGPRTGAAQIVIQTTLGAPGDVPIPGDYNGDGRTDPAIFRPSIGLFFATNAAGNQVLLNTAFGASGDVPVPRDYDGDGRTDPAIYRQNATPQGTLWYAQLSGGGAHQIYFGAPGDVPVPADYNGDKIADSVIFRPSTGLWSGPQTGAAVIVIQMTLGQSGDVPIPGYYDDNLALDPAIFRPSTGLWFSPLSGAGTRSIAGLGQPGDIPVQKRPALAGGT